MGVYCLNDLYQRALLASDRTAPLLWRDAPHETGKFLDANLYMDELAMTDDHGHCWINPFFPDLSVVPDYLSFLTLAQFAPEHPVAGDEDWYIARMDVACYRDQPFGLLISCGRDRYCDYLHRFISDPALFMQAVADLRKVAARPGFAVRLDWRDAITAADQKLDILGTFYGYQLTAAGLVRRPLPGAGDLPFAWLTRANTMVEHLHTFWYDQPLPPGANAGPGGRALTNPVYRAAMLQALFEGMMAEPEPLFSRLAILDYRTDAEWWPLLAAHQGGVFAFATPVDLMFGEAADPSWRMQWRNATTLRLVDPDPARFDACLKHYRPPE